MNSSDKKGLIATIKTDSSTLIDVQGVVGLEGSKVTLKAAAALPALGLNEDAFKMNFAFQPFRLTDAEVNFEVLGEIILMGAPRKIALKFYADKYYNSAIDIAFVGLGKDLAFKMGSEVRLNTLPSPQTLRFFINDVELFIENALHPNERDSMTVQLNADLREFNLGTTSLYGKAAGVWNGFKLEMKAGSDYFFQGGIGSEFVLKDSNFAGNVVIDVNGVHKEVNMLMDINKEGSIEMTYGDGSNDKVRVALSRAKRSAEAHVYDTENGDFSLKISV